MLQQLVNSNLDLEKIQFLLSLEDDADMEILFSKACETRNMHIGNNVYLRGLIEFSNRCSKNCYYCGIRSENKFIHRYEIPEHEILQQAILAYKNNYSSIVLQSGERSDKLFTSRITQLIRKIHEATENSLRITLSCGEQTEKVYREWFNAGAHRYLLRIETSNPHLYKKIHPNNTLHSFEKRKNALQTLIHIGYQTGTGVLIGLPFQTIEDLANDLLFFRDMGIHMIGMGPYIEHRDTPMFEYRNMLLSRKKRVELTLKMIATLRLLMPKINIASTTALQTLDPKGREKGLLAGANIIMPNITPDIYKKNYTLYEGKINTPEDIIISLSSITKQILSSGCVPAYNDWGDPAAY